MINNPKDMAVKQLDNRLKSILSEVSGTIVADIGADHGKLAVAIALSQRAKKVYAVDISAKCLQKTAALATEYGAKSVVCVESDGLQNIPETPDQIIIAGLGGLEISKILSDANYRGRAILVAHSEQSRLREYLSGKVGIEKDYAVASGKKFYQVIVTNSGKYIYKQEELRFGLNFPEREDFKAMLCNRRKEIMRIKAINPLARGGIEQEFLEVEKLCSKLGI